MQGVLKALIENCLREIQRSQMDSAPEHRRTASTFDLTDSDWLLFYRHQAILTKASVYKKTAISDNKERIENFLFPKLSIWIDDLRDILNFF